MPMGITLGAIGLGQGGGVVAAPAIPNLISNGTFDTNTTGWALAGGAGTFTATAGKGVMVVSGTFVTFAWAISTQIGTTYNTLADISDSVDAPFRGVRKADDSGASTNLVELTSNVDGLAQAGNFTATATTTYIILQVNGNRTSFDNISVVAA
ncbi:MAG: hypothetical protein V4696_10185 [Pseudomonadota bacterium]